VTTRGGMFERRGLGPRGRVETLAKEIVQERLHEARARPSRLVS
jgi:hypothetical protein